MFGSIIFDWNPYFGYSATFVYFSILCEFAILLDVYIHFTVPSGRRGAVFFLCKQMYTSGSTFIKKIKPFVCYYISMPCYDMK